MVSGSSWARGNDKVGENQFIGRDDIFSYMQSISYSMMYPEEEAQVNIPTQGLTEEGDRGEEDTTSQKLKSNLFHTILRNQ